MCVCAVVVRERETREWRAFVRPANTRADLKVEAPRVVRVRIYCTAVPAARAAEGSQATKTNKPKHGPLARAS